MTLYGGFQGKRVADKKFKLFRKYKGTRVANKPVRNVFLSQAIELLTGKIKYLSAKFQELEERYMPKEDLESVSVVELKEEEYTDSTKVATIQASSLEDIDDVITYLENGCIVIVNYKLLNGEERKEFDKKLSIELMLLGTHLTHISNSEIICANRQVSVSDASKGKQEGKIYDLRNYIKR